MRVVVPFTDRLRWETVRAVSDWARFRGELEFAYVGDSDDAYSALVCGLWDAGVAFCLVEHDIVPAESFLDGLAGCGERYCAGVYPWTTNVGPALGCTRFDRELLLDLPDAAVEAAGVTPHFRQFDYALVRTVLGRRHGVFPHVHLPPVEHLNEGQALRPEFAALSLGEHLAELGFEVAEDGLTAVKLAGVGAF